MLIQRLAAATLENSHLKLSLGVQAEEIAELVYMIAVLTASRKDTNASMFVWRSFATNESADIYISGLTRALSDIEEEGEKVFEAPTNFRGREAHKFNRSAFTTYSTID